MTEREELHELIATIEKMKRLRHPHIRVGDLKRGEFMTLMGIRDLREESGGDAVSVSELACLHKISPSAMSQALSALEARGLIRRAPDEKDRRAVCVRFTPEGEKLVRAAYEQFHDYMTRLVERLGEEDTRTLVSLLNRLYDVIQEMGEESREQETGNRE